MYLKEQVRVAHATTIHERAYATNEYRIDDSHRLRVKFVERPFLSHFLNSQLVVVLLTNLAVVVVLLVCYNLIFSVSTI